MISNARHALKAKTAKERLFRITARTVQLPNGEYVRIEFFDNGVGIPPENIEKIFDPFFTTKEVGKGTGLGLAICQSIVEQHGGTIQIRSGGAGKGTAVTVRLPLAA